MIIEDENGRDDAAWQTSAENAEQAHGQHGQLWLRQLTIGAPVAISSEAPF
ncbi:hypothetical protein ACU635_50790 [[Actinomadura] parvosata]|uniref:hypothetical protein n=1 Tax=[Actinomadura] parvosata TaxID=1955412 RepID=UPI00406CFFA4